MKGQWYLVQVDLEASKTLCSNYILSTLYYYLFLAKHPADKNKSDKYSRWWLDWYRYSRDYVTKEISFGDRVLFRPPITLDERKYIQWGDSIDFTNNDMVLLGPFNFKAISSTNRTRSKIEGQLWRTLYDVCTPKGLLPPTTGLSTFNAAICNRTHQKKSRKIKYYGKKS